MGALDPSKSWNFEELEPGKDEYVISGIKGVENRLVWDEYKVDEYIGWEIVYQQRWKNGDPYVIVPGVKGSEEFYPNTNDYSVNESDKAIEVIEIPENYVDEVRDFVETKDVKGDVEVIKPL
jgi:hypothetical protein